MPVEHNVIRINGSLPGGEVWSVNPKFYNPDGSQYEGYDVLLAWVETIMELNTGSVLPAAIRTLLSTAGSLVSVRAEYRDAAGNLAQAAEVVATSPIAGTGSASKPYQTSFVSSLLTGRPGRSYRGRLYWPALGAQISAADLRVADVQLNTYVAGIKDFLLAIQNSQPAVGASKLSVVSDTLSVATPVTSIQGGDVLDSQRRRRDSLVEGRVSYAFGP